MARISVILPVGPDGPPPTSALRHALEAIGHDIEIVFAAGPGASGPAGAELAGRWLTIPDPGQAAAAIAGLERSRGDILLALDSRAGYTTADVVRVVEALAAGEADLVVGSRLAMTDRAAPPGRVRRAVAAVTRAVTGSSDPLSGLVGITRHAFEPHRGQFMAAGSNFVIELLAKVEGRRLDVAARPGAPSLRLRPGLDDVRQLKRLADDRYGNFSRLLQFCVVGASGMVVDLTGYAAWQWVFAHSPLAGRTLPFLGGPLDLAVAAVLAIGIALCWNFSLNRRLTFSYARHGSRLSQFAAYTASNALAVSVNLALRLALPQQFSFFNRHRLAAALVGIITATGISFSMSRWVVFRHGAAGSGQARPPELPGEPAAAPDAA
jgi:dolichol-phosphate mannosyltransferase